MPNQFDKEHLKRLLAQEHEIAALFYDLIRAIAPDLANFKNAGKKNIWARNSQLEKRINKELDKFSKALQKTTENYTFQAWEQSNLKNDHLVNDFIKGISLSSAVKEKLFTPNLEAYNAFKEMSSHGLKLSERVWNITTETKTQLEIYLESGIAEGRSAAKISQDVRHLLKDPDKRFRRIRDPKTGKLVLSKPMKNYHPGRGKYRSSYKNALRMTSNFTNESYRLSDHNRWGNLDFITGFEVKLSSSHPEYDICDSMAGKYPKTYVFTGFHVGCICFAVPIMLNPDEFVSSLKGGLISPDRYVSDIPDSAKRYLRDNSERLSNWKSAPTFIEKNFKYDAKKKLYLPSL